MQIMQDALTISNIIEQALQKTASSLAEGLHWFWPFDQREEYNHIIKESNIVTHFAHILLKNDFFVYTEVPFLDDQSLDMYAYSLQHRCEILFEAKGNSSLPGEIVRDCMRMSNFSRSNRPTSWSVDAFNPLTRLNIIATCTRDIKFYDWWMATTVDSCPENCSSKLYQELANQLNTTQKRYGYVLREKEKRDALSNQWDSWRFLYAIFEVPVC